MPFPKFFLPAALGTTFALTLALPAHADIIVKDAYARISGSGALSGAIFLLIENTGAEPDRLVSAETDVSDMAGIHTHTMDANGVMRMGEIEGGVSVAAGESHAFKRGGDHVMLMGLTKSLSDGDHLTLTLTFEQAGAKVIDVQVDNKR